MADNDKNKQSNGGESNPMKMVNTTPLPIKYEFASEQPKENAEKRNKK